MTEQELVELLKKQDPRGFQEVLKCDRQCRKPLADMGIAEEDGKDIFQESIIVLYERLQAGKHRFDSKVCTFLYGVCRKMGLYFLRKNKNKENWKNWDHREFDNSGEPASDQNRLLDELLAEDELPRINPEVIYETIRALPPHCQEIIFAYYYHEVRLTELMDELAHGTMGALKTAKHRCMKRLEDQLKKYLH